MKHKFLFLLLFWGMITISVSAQKVNLDFRQVKLSKVFNAITEQTGLTVAYTRPTVNPDKLVTVRAQNEDLSTVLARLFNDDALVEYEIGNGKIYLKKKTDSKNVKATKKVITLEGKVVGVDGEPLIGATVMVKGSEYAGVTTDLNGNYTLTNVPENSIVTVSYIGYQGIELSATDKTLSHIVLREDNKLLDEVIVVGYGVQKKSDITGSVSSLKREEILSAPAADMSSALQGRVAGVFVQNGTGGPSIRIRGSNSLSYGNDPLVIVDGIPGGLGMNPNEIVSVEVLKDAAATSIYGASGANGVILVTTKRGEAGAMRVSYNTFVSFKEIAKKLPAMNATEYATVFEEAREETGQRPFFSAEDIAALGKGTDWQDEIFNTGFSHHHNLSVSGGTEKIKYYVNANYVNSEGYVGVGTWNRGYNFQSKFSIQANKRLKFDLNTSLGYGANKNMDAGGAVMSAMQWSPTKSIYAEDGTYSQPGGGVGPVGLFNPVAIANEVNNGGESGSVHADLRAEYQLFDFLKISSILRYDFLGKEGWWLDRQVVNNGPASEVGGSHENYMMYNLTSINTLVFDKAFGKHNVQATLVYEGSKGGDSSTSAEGKGFPLAFGVYGLQYGPNARQGTAGASGGNTQSFMGRLNYSYDNRYMASISGRRDGAPQLAEGNKYENFAAFSLGWNIMNEAFMEDYKDVIHELKLRGSYGSVGNAAVPAYSSHMMLYSAFDPITGKRALTVAQLANENLKWERTTELNIGIDSRFWGGRLSITAEYYKKKTKDLLMYQKLPIVLGVPEALVNIGSVSNEGIDFSISGTPVSLKNFKWDINYVMGYNKNKILKLDGISNTLVSGAGLSGTVGSFVQMVGEPMSTFLGYEFAGVWKSWESEQAAVYGAKPGDAKYVDKNKDKKIDKEDIGIIGNGQPDLNFGINNTFRIYDFDLNIFFQGATGNDVYNQNRIRREAYTSDAFPTNPIIKQHWTPQNETDIPAFSGKEYLNSSRWIENGSYLRLKNLTVGYRVPSFFLKKLGVSSLRIYASAENLWTLTDFSDYDPEYIGRDTEAGIYYGAFPSTKNYIVGLDITF